jgi:type 1 glutamine amidotransferase
MTTHTLIKTVASAAFAALAIAGTALAQHSAAEPTVAQPTGPHPAPGTADNFDPVYNVCRGTDPRCYHPWVDNRQNKVLIYTRTAGPRHANLGPALPAGRNPPLTAAHVVQNALVAWMAEQGVAADWTEDVTQLSNLNQYKAVVFASTSRDTLFKHGGLTSATAAVNTTTGAHLDAGRTALRQYIRAGGGFVGIHNAFGTEYNWPWYEGLLGNANYYDHGANQNGTVNIVGHDSSTAGLGSFAFRDEWYNLEPFPTRVKYLATVDENSLATRRTVHPGHGDFHPVAWCQYYDGGRAWLTTMGHDGQAFTDGSDFPGQAQFKSLVVNGILSAMGNIPFCR